MKYVKHLFIALLAILAITTGITSCGNDNDPVITRVTLTYNTNGSTSGTTPTAITQESGTTITLDAGSGFGRTGYIFSGWNTSTDGTGTNYAGTEKIFYPDPKLSTEGAPAGFDPSIGDITVYAPWGNVALFYKDFGYSSGLISVGKITGGMEAFTVSGSITVKFELAE